MADTGHGWRMGVKGWALLGYLALFAAFTLSGVGDPGARRLIGDLAQMPIPLTAGFFLWQVSKRVAKRRERTSWLFLSIGSLTWVGGQAFWSYCEVVQHLDPTTLPASNAIWTMCYPLIVVGLFLQIPARSSALLRATSLLDAALFSLGATGLVWQLVLLPTLGSSVDALPSVFVASWPVGDTLLVFTLISLVLRLRLIQMPLHFKLLFGAAWLQITADVIFAIQVLDGSYHTGSPLDVMWQLVFAAVALASLARLSNHTANQVADPASETPDPLSDLGPRAFLPYLALPAAGVLAYASYPEGAVATGGSGRLMLAMAMMLMVLLVARQFLTLIDNRRLSGSLSELSRELEDRIQERTRELSSRTAELETLNRVATRISHCLTPYEVVSTGLELACETTGMQAGVVWLRELSGKLEVAERRGLNTQTDALLSDLPSQCSAATEAIQSGTCSVMRRSALLAEPMPSYIAGHIPPAVLIVPLLSRGSVLGALGLIMTDDRPSIAPECQIGQAIGAQVGVALENTRRYEEALLLADRDPVTNLLNHRAVYQRIEQELKRAHRGGQQLSIAMMDLDNFQMFNDTHGHLAGDQVLKSVAALMRDGTRSSDVLGRYGGDEFVAILPDTGTEAAIVVAERLRAVLASHPYVTTDGHAIPMHMSLGIATYPQNGRYVHELMGFADANLYESKLRGGNTITIGDPSIRDGVAKIGSFGVLDGLVTAVDNKDHYTRKHSEDVTRYALWIASSLGLSEETQRTLRLAGLLHDVGKIGVPDRILRKPAKLDAEEQAIVKQHAVLGELVIKDIPNTSEVLAAVGSHHERFDGQGYPRGLQGEQIPLLGRILAVADAYSAMTTDRPYRKAMRREEAVAELKKAAGTQLDPDLVREFMTVLENVGLSAAALR